MPRKERGFMPSTGRDRIVHGLVGLVLKWRRVLPGQEPLHVIVRNFDQAQHLATRFFVELARRAMPGDRLEIIVETRNSSGPALVSNLDPVPDATGRHDIAAGLDDVIANASEAVLEENSASTALLLQDLH